MTEKAFDRTVRLVGEEGFNRIAGAHVAVVGLGGVGGAATEILARAGVGELTLADGDKFEPSNLNRQILCTSDVIGEYKATVACRRVASINQSVKAHAVTEFVGASNVERILDGNIMYCVDAIDDVKNKLVLIAACNAKNIPIICAMGAGNRLDCGAIITDIFKTSGDPLARKMRRELKSAGITELTVASSTALPIKNGNKGVMSFAAPPIDMGVKIASYVIQSILGGLT